MAAAYTNGPCDHCGQNFFEGHDAACPANHAKPEGQQQPDSSEGSKTQSGEQSDRFGNVENFQGVPKPLVIIQVQTESLSFKDAQRIREGLEGNIAGYQFLIHDTQSNVDATSVGIAQLIEAFKQQSADAREQIRSFNNLATHIALLIQAMADGEDDTGTGPDTRTLG